MPFRAVLFLLLLGAAGHAEVTVPQAAQRYLDILKRRPQPGTIFERFHSAWLEEGTAAGLLEHLTTEAARPEATAADHLVLALCHAHRGDDAAALAAYEKALTLEPKNASAWVERSRLEARLLDFESSLKSLDQAAAAGPAEALALDIAKLKGRALVRLGRQEDALRVWKELVAAHAEDEELTEEVIDLFVDEGQLDAAIEASRALVGRSRDAVARTLRQLRLADILMIAERRDESLTVLDAALTATGTDTWIEGDVLGRIERVFRMTDDIAGLEKHLAKLLAAQPQRVNLAWQHALLLAATGQHQVALEAARALLQSNPGRNDLREGFLDLLDSLDQTQEAVAQAQALAAQNPQDKELLIRLATLQQRGNDLQGAVTTLENYVTVAGAAEPDLLRVARILESWEKPPAKADSPASKAYRRLVEAFPDSSSAKEVYAHYLHRSGRRDEALALWQTLAQSGTLEDLLRIAQALQSRLESRPALDLLLGREHEFGGQPRYLALLVQTAVANEEYERALPWALARLALMRSGEDIENALVPLRLILRYAGQFTSPLVEKLQKQSAPGVQDRCLLAVLLNERGDLAEAEKLLATAPENDAVICLGELSRLHQANHDWKKAAQTLRKLVDLPGNKTPARLQMLVDMLRRDNQPQEALTLITDWKAVAPGAVEPWLVEAKVLAELYRGEEVLKVLRQAMRKFPDAPEAANAYATACLNASQPEEAERVYLALYEKTTDTAARLRLLSPLALAAESRNALPKLIENFQRRQQQNRASAYPWLALAEIHRAVNDTDSRLRCLHEASRMRPQDVSLLTEIARCEEDAGLYPEAIRTLEAAAKLDKTTRARQLIAKIQIENGDAEEGYRILFDLSNQDLMAPAAIEATASALASQRDWERLVGLLPGFLEKHPGHYRLHYLRGVALEESDQPAEALAAFLRVMDIHEELPGTTASAPAEPEVEDLPAGAREWVQMLAVSGKAYGYRNEAASAPASPLLPPVAGSNQVLLPEDVTVAPGFALVHALQISSTATGEDRQRVVRQLKRLGVSQPDLLFEAAQKNPELTLDAEMLAAHPDDLALHAAWLLGGWQNQDAADFAALEHCFTLFEQRYPHLALQTVQRALRSDFVDQPEVWIRRVIEVFGKLPRGDERAWRLAQSLLRAGFGEDLRAPAQLVELNEAQTESLVQTVGRWMQTETDLDQLVEMTGAMMALARWDHVLTGFQHLIELASRPNAPQVPRLARGGATVTPLEPAPLPVASFLPDFPPYIAALVDLMTRRKGGEGDVDLEHQEIAEAMRRRIPTINEPRLQLLLRLLCDDTKPLVDEWKIRVTRPEATVQDFLGMSWLLEREKDLEGALQHLQSARKRATDAALIERIDSASLHLAFQFDREGNAELANAAARLALEKWTTKPSSPPQKEQIVLLMERFGMEDEMERLSKSLPKGGQPAPVRNTAAIANPYSQALLRRGGVDGRDTLDRLLIQNNGAGALAEAARRMRRLVSDWHSSQAGTNTAQEMTQLLLKLEMHQLRQPFLTSIKGNATTGWKARLEHAAVLSMQHAHGRVFQFNDGDTSLDSEALLNRALSEYEAVLAANPKADEARRKIVEMTATEDNATALKHWTQLPEMAQHGLLSSILRKAREKGRTETTLSAASLITAWLKNLDPLKRRPAWLAGEFTEFLDLLQRGDGCPGLWETFGTRGAGEPAPHELAEPLRRQRNDRRIAHDALCRALMRLPDLAPTGFAPYAGLRMFEGRDLDETAELALQSLAGDGRATSKGRRAPVRRSNLPDSTAFEAENRIPMPSPALFATWEAARRRDTAALEERIFPAVLRSEGQAVHDFCKGYAEVMMADDTQFPAVATAWVQKLVPARGTDVSAFTSGGIVHEILHLWRQRNCPGSLDDLFIAYRDLNLQSADPFAAGPPPSAMDDYVGIIASRDPDALRRFIRLLRDAWTSPDAELRRRAIAGFQANERLNRSSRNSPLERSAGRYVEWLARQMKSQAGLVAFEFAVEDGAQDSSAWASRITARGQEVETAGEFIVLMKALGCLDKELSKLLSGTQVGQTGRTVQVVRDFRDSRELAVVRDAVAQLGEHHPATLTGHLVQALLVRDGVDSFKIGDKAASLPAASAADNLVPRQAAFRLVLLHHAAEIAALPAADRLKLGAFFSNELPGFVDANHNDAALKKALAPIIQAARDELAQRAGSMLAAKRWEDLAPNRGSSETQVILRVLRDLAVEDKPRGIALARHAVALLKQSAEQQKAVAASQPETPADRFIMALGQAPQLLALTLDLAGENGLDRSITWCSSLAYRFDAVLKNSETALWALKDTPFVAEAAGFRDFPLDDAEEPTQICRIVTCVEKDQKLRSIVEPWLAKTPPTFGTRLLTALLHRDAKESAGLLSFYGQRPDPQPVVTFLIQSTFDLPKLAPEVATNLLTLLETRLPDLAALTARNEQLKKALQPLIKGREDHFNAAREQTLRITNLRAASLGVDETIRRCVWLLDHLAPQDKARALEVLDHVSKLMAAEQLSRAGTRIIPPQQSDVAQWLQAATVVPELFSEIMQRAETSGAAASAEWKQATMNRLSDVHRLEHRPGRLIGLMEDAHVLDAAATFTPLPIPLAETTPTLLESWLPALTKWQTLPPLLEKRANVFGTDLLRLLIQPGRSDDAVVAFCKAHADEIDGLPDAQKKVIGALFARLGWKTLLRSHLPALGELFQP